MIKIEGLCYICRGRLQKGRDGIKCSVCGYNISADNQEYVLISAEEVNQKIKEGENFIFLDIRTPLERKISKIDRTLNIPMEDISEKLGKLDKNLEVVVFCHTGGRSYHVARFLGQKGFSARSMDGGIESWAEEIDSEIERY
jgi:rhodanese-related sulfurtransferase